MSDHKFYLTLIAVLCVGIVILWRLGLHLEDKLKVFQQIETHRAILVGPDHTGHGLLFDFKDFGKYYTPLRSVQSMQHQGFGAPPWVMAEAYGQRGTVVEFATYAGCVVWLIGGTGLPPEPWEVWHRIKKWREGANTL